MWQRRAGGGKISEVVVNSNPLVWFHSFAKVSVSWVEWCIVCMGQGREGKTR